MSAAEPPDAESRSVSPRSARAPACVLRAPVPKCRILAGVACAGLCAIVLASVSRSSADDTSSQLVFSSLFGSASGQAPVIFLSIVAGPEGTIYLSGRTTAGGFPTTPNALKPNPPAEANRPSLPFLATVDPSSWARRSSPLHLLRERRCAGARRPTLTTTWADGGG